MKKINKVIIADQSDIPLSDNAKSLFYSKTHILCTDDYDDYPLVEIAQSMAKSIGTQVICIKLTEYDIALSVASKMNKIDELNQEIKSAALLGNFPDLDQWCQGYDNDNVQDAIELKLNRDKTTFKGTLTDANSNILTFSFGFKENTREFFESDPSEDSLLEETMEANIGGIVMTGNQWRCIEACDLLHMFTTYVLIDKIVSYETFFKSLGIEQTNCNVLMFK